MNPQIATLSDPVLISIIVAIGSTPPSILGLFTLWHQTVIDRRTRLDRLNLSAAVVTVATEVKAQTANIATIEKATNSMKDALVKATGEAAHAAGVKDERSRASAETLKTETDFAAGKASVAKSAEKS